MNQRFAHIFRTLFFPILLCVIVGIIAFANYTPGTFLSGWDTLQPELNMPLAFKRALTGVWRQDQGLGATAIQSHMAELPRLIYLWVMSLVLPLSALRYSYFFLMLIAGPLGIYYFLQKIVIKDARFVSFVGALVYLTTYGTLQHFVVPLEMFATHYGLLPWLLLAATRVMTRQKKSDLLVFLLLSFFVTSQAHTATLAYIYITNLSIYLLALTFTQNNRRMAFQKTLILIISTVFINAYWLLPNLYAAKTHGLDVRDSKINQLFSPEAFAKNQLFGTIENAAVLKNFLFDWQIYNFKTRSFEPMLKPWQDHGENPLIPIIGYGTFILAIVGIIAAIDQKNKIAFALLPVAGISFLLLLNGTWPMTVLFERLGNISLLAKEALRFPFTKFSILFMFTLAVYSAMGINAILSFTKKIRPLTFIIPTIAIVLLLYYFLPSFTDNLIHPAMRIQIPQAYTDMFHWFDGQNHNDRVAILPIHTFWNWTYNSWGYQGAGFLQFGIPQPILDRDYDRWSPYNEQYQREMTYALYSQNPQYFKHVLIKYNITWILFDRSVISPGENDNVTLDWLIPSLVEQSGITRPSQQFGNDITVYKVTTPKTDISLYKNLLNITPKMQGAPHDWTYDQIGPYLTDETTNSWTDSYREMFDRSERFLGTIDGNPVATVSANTSEYFNKPVVPCAGIGGIYYGKTVVNNDSIQYESKEGPHCDYFPFPNLDHGNSYVVEITSRNLSGFPLQVCIANTLTRHCDVTIHLQKSPNFVTEKILLPRLFDYGTGYSLNLNNFAIKGVESMNELKIISIREVSFQPYVSIPRLPVEITPIDSSHPNPSYYTVQLPTMNDQPTTLVLSQSFDPGWKAYELPNCQLSTINCQLKQALPFLFGRELTDHVLVNNWANGWRIPARSHVLPATSSPPRTIVLFFLPQLLQWLGFLLLPIPFIIAFRATK